MLEKNKIAVVGLGYVGLPLAILAQKKGYKVLGIDKDKNKIDLIKKHHSPFLDKEIETELQNINLEVTTNFEKLKDVSVIAICVPTPVSANHMPELGPVQSASENIASNLQKNQLVILESTVNPGICENFILPILEKKSGLTGGRDFFLAHCPERINPGDKTWNVENIPRVIGGLEEKSLKLAYNFYKSVLTGKIKKMGSIKEAEAVKIVENSFRDVNIAFVNELAQSFWKLGIDVKNVIDGAATKPFSFMPHYPGCGVGGHCIPVDPYYLIEYAKTNGFNHDFLAWARRINNSMPKFTVERVVESLNKLKIPMFGSKIAVLGLAYKPDISDTRESPSFKIIKHLEEYGAKVIVFDPYVSTKSTGKDLESTVKNAKAVILATAHNQFLKKLSSEFLAKNNVRVFVDGRNSLKKEDFAKSGVLYTGIGR